MSAVRAGRRSTGERKARSCGGFSTGLQTVCNFCFGSLIFSFFSGRGRLGGTARAPFITTRRDKNRAANSIHRVPRYTIALLMVTALVPSSSSSSGRNGSENPRHSL